MNGRAARCGPLQGKERFEGGGIVDPLSIICYESPPLMFQFIYCPIEDFSMKDGRR
jgi:hypothetical protein